MTKQELKELRKAIKSVCRPEHTLYIEGKAFKCEWKENHFVWHYPSGLWTSNLSAREVLRYIGNGEYITYFCYDYVSDGESEESA